MFTTEHFIWIAICAVFIAAMTVIGIKNKWNLKRAGRIMMVICVLSEVSKVMSSMIESPGGGRHLDPLSLPFHLCSLIILAVVYIVFGKEGKAKRLVINFVSVMGTVGSFLAIMIPTNGTDFSEVTSYQCFVYHAGLMWFAIYLIISGEAKLNFKSLLENTGVLVLLSFIMLYVNGALSVYDTNFFYLTRPPMENLPYLNLDKGWYVYFGRMLFLGILLRLLFHIPFIINNRNSFSAAEQKSS